MTNVRAPAVTPRSGGHGNQLDIRGDAIATDALSNIIQLYVINGRVHCSATAVTQHNDQFRANDFAAIFHTGQYIDIDDIPRNPGNKNITNTLVENIFNGYPAVQA
jgi:hypothetical protein